MSVSVRGKYYVATLREAKKEARNLRRKHGMKATVSKTKNLKKRPGHARHNYTVYYYR